MSPFEYLLPLVSVLVGLAVADASVSLHRLLRARHRVRWDGLPLATAALAVLTVLNVWWTFYARQGGGTYTALAGFLPLAAVLVLLFLINAASLPDEVPPGGLDLRAFYDENARYFWTLYAAFVIVVTVERVRGYVGARSAGDGSPALDAALEVLFNVPFVASCLLLAVTRRRWVHVVVVAAMLVVSLWNWWGLRLALP